MTTEEVNVPMPQNSVGIDVYMPPRLQVGQVAEQVLGPPGPPGEVGPTGGMWEEVREYTASVSNTPTPAGIAGGYVTAISGGSGGGSGRRGAAGTIRGGGGGGCGSGVYEVWVPAADWGPTYTVNIGGPGAGGAAVTADDTNGNGGGAGGFSNLTTTNLSISSNGTGGGGAGTVTGAGGGAGNGPAQGTGTTGGAASGTGAVGGAATALLGSPGAGGAGGGITSANAASGGGVGSAARTMHGNTANGGVVDGALPNAGSTYGPGCPGGGGGGGASSITQAAQAGANGGTYGGGGGGGGASLNGFASGKGGNGGPGYARVRFVYQSKPGGGTPLVVTDSSTVDLTGGGTAADPLKADVLPGSYPIVTADTATVDVTGTGTTADPLKADVLPAGLPAITKADSAEIALTGDGKTTPLSAALTGTRTGNWAVPTGDLVLSSDGDTAARQIIVNRYVNPDQYQFRVRSGGASVVIQTYKNAVLDASLNFFNNGTLSVDVGGVVRPVPFATQAMSVTVSGTSSATYTGVATYAVGRFTVSPLTIGNCVGSGSSVYAVSFNTHTAASCSVAIRHLDNTAATGSQIVYLLAIQMTPTAAVGFAEGVDLRDAGTILARATCHVADCPNGEIAINIQPYSLDGPVTCGGCGQLISDVVAL